MCVRSIHHNGPHAVRRRTVGVRCRDAWQWDWRDSRPFGWARDQRLIFKLDRARFSSSTPESVTFVELNSGAGRFVGRGYRRARREGHRSGRD